MRVLPKGTEIICPKCKRTLVRLARTLKSGDRLRADDFEPVAMAPVKHTKMLCAFDQEPYGRANEKGKTSLHTREGWT